MSIPPPKSLESQVHDAAQTLQRTTDRSTLVAALYPGDGSGTAVTWRAEEMTLGEIELTAFILLRYVAEQLAVGAAGGCDSCITGSARVSAAVATLEIGFLPGSDFAGRC